MKILNLFQKERYETEQRAKNMAINGKQDLF